MPRRVPRSTPIARGRRWRRQRRLLRLALIAGVLCVLAVICARLSRDRTPARNPDSSALVAQAASPRARAAFPGRLGRPVYKHSVIPGGAYSPEELRQALDSDAVAARHYAGFERASLRTEPSHFVQPVYLSYRVGNEVFWTRRPVALPPLETLLTDGVHFARARCGNQVAVEPQSPVQAAGPPAGEFDVATPPAVEPSAANREEPLLAAEVLPEFPPGTGPQTGELAPETIEDIEHGLGGGSGEETAGPPPVAQPAAPVAPAGHWDPDLPFLALFSPLDCWALTTLPGEAPYILPNRAGCTPYDWPRYHPIGSGPQTPPQPPETPPGPLGTPPDSPPETPIPEPGSLVLTLSALGVAAVVRRLGWRERRPGAAHRAVQP